jgi:hypothetical protein
VGIRGIRIGAVLLPLCVALIPIGVLLWYGLVRIPTQEAYLNERNLRLLTTLSGGIKAKIDSFDGAIDHAVRSYGSDVSKERFQDGLQLFAPELEVLQKRGLKKSTSAAAEADAESAIDEEMVKSAADPPRVRIERDEGRYYMYLGARLEDEKDSTAVVVTRVDLEATVRPFLAISSANTIASNTDDAGQEFVAILLTTSSGEVIAQNSPVGLTLAQLDTVIGTKDHDGQPVGFDSLSSFSNTIPVTIGEVDYKLYLQPVALSLLSTADGDYHGRSPERWALCGLVRADRFRADTSALSYTTLLWFSAFLALLALAIPFVKLRALKAHERLRAGDAVWVTAATVAAVGILTLGALDVYAFGFRFSRDVDERLAGVARSLSHQVAAEVEKIAEQAQAFEKDTKPEFVAVSRELKQKHEHSPRITVTPTDGQPRFGCVPEDACHLNVLSDRSDGNEKDQKTSTQEWAYPFFDLMTWTGDDGWQRVRKTPGSNLRPFINIFEERLPYAARVRDAWQTPNASPKTGVDVVSSPNTGDPLTVFWRTGTTDDTPPLKWMQSVAMTTLVSLDGPVLPKGVSFAVVDQNGEVLFHSDPNRRLRENFLRECDDDPALRSALRRGGLDGATLKIRYLARPHSLYLVPLTMASLGNGDPQWRLVVFEDSAIVDTVNLETLTIACWLFAIYAAALGIAAILLYGLSREPRKWFWPDPRKRAQYVGITLLNASATVIFLAILLVAREYPATLLIATAVLAILTGVATHRIVARESGRSADSTTYDWRHPFFLARATSLLVVVCVPAIASFQVAYTFEATLLAKSEQAQGARDRNRLTVRNARKAELLDNDARVPRQATTREQARLEAGRPQSGLEETRKQFASFDTYVPLWPASSSGAPGGWLDRRLMTMHRQYNDVAIDLASAAGAAPGPRPPAMNAGWLVLIIVVLVVVCYAVVYWLVKPLFVLEAVASPVITPTSDDARREHVLMIGPPGAGKSTRLEKQRGIRVFDIATRSYVDRRRRIVLVSSDRRGVVGAAVGGVSTVAWNWLEGEQFRPEPSPGESPAAGWADAFDYATLPLVLGIDHLDYRLEDRNFAAQTLTFLERAMSRNGRAVHITADREPLACLTASGAPQIELERWVRALRVFRKDVVGVGKPTAGLRTWHQESSGTPAAVNCALLDECRRIPRLKRIRRELLRTLPGSTTVSDALAAFGLAASPYYEALWNACTADERLAIHQLADEDLVNPQNETVVRDLLRKGLLVRDPRVRVMNKTFAEFARHAMSAAQVHESERRGLMIPWGSIEAAMLTVVVILAGLLIVTQERLLNAWIGFLPTLMPAVQKLWNAVTGLKLPAKSSAA